MKHALALILACCALVAQDKPSVPDPLEEAKNGRIAQDGRALSKSVELGLLIVQLNSLADSIKQNEAAAQRFWTARSTQGIPFDSMQKFDRAYLDFSTLALEQRKLWTQTLSRIMDLSK
jgi:hypothetical protein